MEMAFRGYPERWPSGVPVEMAFRGTLKACLPDQRDPADTAKTIDEITEKDLRANKTLLLGRKIKRFFPGLGGSWGLVVSYDVGKDMYKLRYGVDGYTEKLAFEDVLKLLPKSWFRKRRMMHEA